MRRAIAFCCNAKVRVAALSVLCTALAFLLASIEPWAAIRVAAGVAACAAVVLITRELVELHRQLRKTWAAWAAFNAARAPRYEGRHDGRG